MDNTIWIIAFSKYSKLCNELFAMIDELGVQTSFQLLDIDNKELRKRIKSTSNFSIEYVPCIISINAVGIASQYEGQKAFEVVRRLYGPPPKPIQYHPQQPIQYQQPPPSQEQHPPPSQESQMVHRNEPSGQGVTLIENLVDEPLVEEPGKSSAIKGNKLSVSQIMKNVPKTNQNSKCL